ncbi:amidohydrolase [Nocardia uniformis]|uniref:Amidohydrolase n=2 Tax=Nocardia uniformis TaxID=53432 RepID=A0A849BVA3_9NOCA|nr:amidohydrolase [Nocardia uniformis]NNH70523.1 amidohydrolase [Nocardia uniformis]
MSDVTAINSALAGLDAIRSDLADFYRDLHTHPELSGAEHRTADEVAKRATALGYQVTTGVGGTGVVAVLANGTGPTVLLRADFDALPIREATGLPYASQADLVMHACGHDMHATCLLGALKLLADARHSWSGTVLAVFQPAEETGRGAQAMVDDGLFDRFGKPDIVLAQHTAPFPVGVVGGHGGTAAAATDALRIIMHGHGGHGSRPEVTIDPVVMAAATVMRLQTIVSREVAADDAAVVTVGMMRAGTKDNIIPDDAELRLNIRTFTPETRAKVLAAVDRIVQAEAAAAGAEWKPDTTVIDAFPVLVNDIDATRRTMAAFGEIFGPDKVFDPGRLTGSEDVGTFATAAGAPICFWLFGVLDPELFGSTDVVEILHDIMTGQVDLKTIPGPHTATYAPVIDPSITIGVTAMTTAALTWLGTR